MSYQRVFSRDTTSERSRTVSQQSSSYEVQPLEGEQIRLVDFNAASRPPTTTSKRQSLKSTLAWWMPEIIASVFSVATFISIVLVLRNYDGKPLTALHLPKYLTLNGLIAALATLNRSFLVTPVGSAIMQEVWLLFAANRNKPTKLLELERFDMASRGSFGSLAFLFLIRSHRLLAGFGALITVVSLAMGTFTQQLISYDRMVPISYDPALEPGNIPRAETFDKSVGNPAEGGDASSPPFEVVAALYNGVLSGGIAPLTASCPTGNCTWPLTPSLAVCGGCVNQEYGPPDCFTACAGDFIQSTTSTHLTSEANCTTYEDIYCNYTMPSGSVVTLLNWDNKTLVDELSGAYPGFQAISGTGAHWNASKEDRLYLSNFDMFGAAYETYSVEQFNYTSTECALWFCVETYNISTDSNQQKEEVVSTMSDLNATTFQFPPIDASADPHNKTSFNVSEIPMYIMQTWFAATLNGGVGLNMESFTFSSDLMKGIWNGTNDPEAWIQNIATSLTNVVRQTTSNTREEYKGTAYQLGVSVRWAWLALPGALVALSIIFLVMVMIRTVFSPVAPWKGSPLTFLLFNIEDTVKEASYGQANRARGLQNAVGNVPVKLVQEDGRTWKFKTT